MSKIETSGIILDVDNTLLATNLFVLEHIINTCIRLKVKPPNKKTVKKIQKENLTFENIFYNLFGKKQGEKVLKAYRETAPELNYKPTPYAIEFIHKTDELCIPTSIVTNRTRMIVNRLEQAGFDIRSFEDITSLDAPKPDKHAYDSAIKSLLTKGAKIKTISFFGDHPHDYLAVPKKLNNNFYALLTGLSTKSQFLEAGLPPKNIYKNFQEIIDIIALPNG